MGQAVALRYSRFMRRIERLINLIAALLETRRPMTAEEIRERIGGYQEQPTMEAFRRAFERDKEDLRAMGIPLEVVQSDPFSNQADAYVIPRSRYYLPEIDLAPDEHAALGLAAQAILGAGEEAAAGFLKLSVDQPDSAISSPAFIWGADVAAEEPLLAPLYEAVLERQRVRFQYQPASGEAGVRVVEPYALLHRKGHWYLTGRDVDKDAVRSFKLARILSDLEMIGGGYEVPADFDLTQHVGGDAWQIGEAEIGHAIVRFDPVLRWWPEQNMPGAPVRDAAGGAIDVEVTISNLDAFVSWVLGFGDAVEVIAPPAARERVLSHLDPFLQLPTG